MNCLKCGHAWRPIVSNPARCPNCKTAAWMTPKGVGPRRANGEKIEAGSSARVSSAEGSTGDVRTGSEGRGDVRSNPVPRVAVAEVLEDEELAGNLCKGCEGALMIAKGFWVCGDQSCGLYGKQQGRV